MDLQTLRGTHLAGDGSPVGGRSVRATPVAKQFVGIATIDTQPITADTTTDAEGNWSLSLVQGAIYDIKVERWGTATIQITADANKDFVAYLGENAVLGGTVPGSVKFETGESVTFFLFQDTEGVYQLGWRVVA